MNVPDFGITSGTTAKMVEEFIREATGRIKGVGDTQYNLGGFQAWEGMRMERLIAELQAEALDLGNYAAFIYARAARLANIYKAMKRNLEESSFSEPENSQED